jgi:hypothetical protein
MGVLAFIDVGVENTSPSFDVKTCSMSNNNCVQGAVTFAAGLDFDANGKLTPPPPLKPICFPVDCNDFTKNIFTTGQNGIPAIPSVNFTCQNAGGSWNAPDIVQSTDPGKCSAVVNYTPTATDSCGNPISSSTYVITPPSGSVFPKGTTTVNS